MGITYYYMDHNVKEPFTSNPLYEQVYTLRNNIYVLQQDIQIWDSYVHLQFKALFSI